MPMPLGPVSSQACAMRPEFQAPRNACSASSWPSRWGLLRGSGDWAFMEAIVAEKRLLTASLLVRMNDVQSGFTLSVAAGLSRRHGWRGTTDLVSGPYGNRALFRLGNGRANRRRHRHSVAGGQWRLGKYRRGRAFEQQFSCALAPKFR
ncbi:hypothetical protein MTBLM1_10208 [Rhodospirillaceae bacterium LM-1]|nr:hypothetical protein MTBLM1_10208 [Rhodospirillaceae bacterium LM-1]